MGTPKLSVPGAAVLVGCKIVAVLVVADACPPEGRGAEVKPPKENGAASVVAGRVGFVKEKVDLGWSPTAGKVEAEDTLLLANGAVTGGNPVLETGAASGFFPRMSITLPVTKSDDG